MKYGESMELESNLFEVHFRNLFHTKSTNNVHKLKKNIQVFPSSYAQLNPLVYVSCMEQVSSLTAVQTIDVKHE